MLPAPVRFLVTAGPTREMIDPVRFISNRSSGKMGYALAEAARDAGGKVTLVAGPTSLQPPHGMEVTSVLSAEEMAAAVLERFAQTDVVIMAAAVCDFRPKRAAADKIKKQAFNGVLELEPTIDILAELGRRKTVQFLAGFAVETRDLEGYAADKLARKNLDMIVANTTEAFDGDTNAVTLLYRDGSREQLDRQGKRAIARQIVARISERRMT